MNTSDIITALKSQVENAAGLSYVKQTLIGQRQIETITMYPTIIIEPVLDQESQDVYNRFENRLTVQIVGLINVSNAEKQIVGDENTKGILDFVSDVKTALDADYTLSGNAIHLVIGDTQFSSELFPVRMFALEVEIWYRQTKSVRT